MIYRDLKPGDLMLIYNEFLQLCVRNEPVVVHDLYLSKITWARSTSNSPRLTLTESHSQRFEFSESLIVGRMIVNICSLRT